MVRRRLVEKILFTLTLVRWHVVSRLSVSSPALTLEEALALAKSTLPAYQAQATRVQSSEALYKATFGAYVPSVDAAGTAYPAQHRRLRLLFQQLRRDRIAQALRLQAGLYTGYRPLQLQLRTGRPPQEPPGPRIQREVLFLHDPGNPGHPRAAESSARQRPEKLRGGRRAEKVRRGKALRCSSGLCETGAGPLQPGPVGRQPPEEPLGAELPYRHTRYRSPPSSRGS